MSLNLQLRLGFAFKNQNFNQQQVNFILQPKIVPAPQTANCPLKLFPAFQSTGVASEQISRISWKKGFDTVMMTRLSFMLRYKYFSASK